MLELGMDANALRRLDNAAVVDFLSSAASALAKEGLFSAKDVDELRVCLSAITSAPDSRERPVMLELERANADILSVLRARYGHFNLSLNLLRYALRSSLNEARRQLADFGQALVKKAELNFNRPVTLTGGGRPQKLALYSTLIIDFSQAIADTYATVEQVSTAMAAMHSHAMAAGTARDTTIDAEIAKSLGFDGLTSHSLPGLSERAAKRKFAAAMLNLADVAQGVSDALGTSSHGYATALACEALASECQRLEALELPVSESLLDWEVRRRSLVGSFRLVNKALHDLASASLTAIGSGAPDVPGAYPEAAKRRIATDLMATGIGSKVAWSATESLFSYLTAQQLPAEQLIAGELPRIHPSLTSDALTTLQALSKDRSTMSMASSEKGATMARVRQLAEHFKKGLAELTVLALILLTTACGLKTRLVSNVVELRPDIPFHQAPPSPGVPHESSEQQTNQ